MEPRVVDMLGYNSDLNELVNVAHCMYASGIISIIVPCPLILGEKGGISILPYWD